MLTAVSTGNRITAEVTGSTVQVAVSGQSSLVEASGGSGPPGVGTLSELTDVTIASLAPGDLLRNDGSRWRNYPEQNLTDGGNF